MSFGQWPSDYLGVPLEERFNFNPLTYFLYSGVDGAWFDPEDMSTMFQDAAGTIPVTAMEQPVGKWLDKSGNGNHATQSITASRPTLSARYNLLTKTEYFADGVWDKRYCTISSNVAQAPNGTISADKMVISSGTWEAAQASNRATVGGSIPVIAKVTMKAGEKSIGYIQCNSEGGSVVSTLAMFNLSTGTKGSLITIAGAGLINPIAGITPLSNGFYECSLSFTTNATAGPVYVIIGFCDSMSSRSVVGDDIGGAYIFSADLRIGTSGPYQRVNTATDYDSVGWPKYLRFDGIDDYLNLPYMGLYAGGACTSVMARDEILPTLQCSFLTEGSTSSANPLYYHDFQLANQLSSGAFLRNDAAVDVKLTAVSAGEEVSVCMIKSMTNTGASFIKHRNSIKLSEHTYSPTGTFTLNTTTIGATRSTTVLSYAKMNLYGLIITKSALSDTDRRRCEQFLASRLSTLGVTLS